MLAAGAGVAAVSVDAPERSEAVRAGLALSFPILCDTERRVIREWGVYNAGERGGIAEPAVFLIDREKTIRYAGVDAVVRRVAAVEMLALVEKGVDAGVGRRVHVPRWSEWVSAIRNQRKR